MQSLSKWCIRTVSFGAEVPELTELTMPLLYHVVLLHPVGCELIGRYSRKSRAMQTLDTLQQQQHNSICYTHISQQHDVTSRLDAVMVSIYEGR